MQTDNILTLDIEVLDDQSPSENYIRLSPPLFHFICERERERELRMGTKEAEAELQLRGQADIWKYMFSFADTMAVKCAVELRIPDIINMHGEPITLSQIVAGIPDAHSPDISYLARIMRLLVRRKIFAYKKRDLTYADR